MTNIMVNSNLQQLNIYYVLTKQGFIRVTSAGTLYRVKYSSHSIYGIIIICFNYKAIFFFGSMCKIKYLDFFCREILYFFKCHCCYS